MDTPPDITCLIKLLEGLKRFSAEGQSSSDLGSLRMPRPFPKVELRSPAPGTPVPAPRYMHESVMDAFRREVPRLMAENRRLAGELEDCVQLLSSARLIPDGRVQALLDKLRADNEYRNGLVRRLEAAGERFENWSERPEF